MSKLAIVIPYFKIIFFEECLESLYHQTNQNFTVYIGDDCSPNSPEKIIQKFNKKLNIHYIKFDTNIGSTDLTQQWSRCIDLINNEEWIMLLGDDDKLSNNVIEEFFQAKNDLKDKNVVRCNVTEIDGYNNILREFNYPKLEKASTSFIKKITEDYHISLPEYIFKKDTYKKYGFKSFPFAFGSDEIAWLEFSEGNYIYTLPTAICYMRLSEFNISGNKQSVKEKVYAKYLTNKYIIANIFNSFNQNEKKIVIAKGYQYLLFSDSRRIKERIYYILTTFKYLNIKDIKNIFLGIK